MSVPLHRRLVAAFLAIGFVEPAYAVLGEQKPKELSITGTYVHSGSGLEFPERVGDFQRVSVTEFGEERIWVGYNLESPSRLIAATMYLYPWRDVPFSDELAEIEAQHDEFKFAFEQEVILEKGQSQLKCRLAGMSYVDWFAHRRGPVSSYLMLCDDRPWQIKWRFTHLPTADAEIGGIMKALAAAVTVRK